MKTSFTPHLASTAPSRTTTPSGARSSTTNSASLSPSTSLTPSTIAPRAKDPSKASVLQGVEQQSLLHSPFLPSAHRTLGATGAMVLATSSETAPARNPTLLQLTKVM
jgi:hypothetical protein